MRAARAVLVAGQRPRAAQRHRARDDPRAGPFIEPAAPAAADHQRSRRRRMQPQRGARPGTTVEEAERRLITDDARAHPRQQDARRGNSRHQPEDAAQQAEQAASETRIRRAVTGCEAESRPRACALSASEPDSCDLGIKGKQVLDVTSDRRRASSCDAEPDASGETRAREFRGEPSREPISSPTRILHRAREVAERQRRSRPTRSARILDCARFSNRASTRRPSPTRRSSIRRVCRSRTPIRAREGLPSRRRESLDALSRARCHRRSFWRSTRDQGRKPRVPKARSCAATWSSDRSVSASRRC